MWGMSRGRRGILQTRVPIACVAFAAAACAVVSCGSAGTGAAAGAGRSRDTGGDVALRGSRGPGGQGGGRHGGIV